MVPTDAKYFSVENEYGEFNQRITFHVNYNTFSLAHASWKIVYAWSFLRSLFTFLFAMYAFCVMFQALYAIACIASWLEIYGKDASKSPRIALIFNRKLRYGMEFLPHTQHKTFSISLRSREKTKKRSEKLEGGDEFVLQSAQTHQEEITGNWRKEAIGEEGSERERRKWEEEGKRKKKERRKPKCEKRAQKKKQVCSALRNLINRFKWTANTIDKHERSMQFSSEFAHRQFFG